MTEHPLPEGPKALVAVIQEPFKIILPGCLAVIVCLMAFLALAEQSQTQALPLLAWNQDAMAWVQSLQTPLLDIVAKTLSFVGGKELLLPLSGVIAFVLFRQRRYTDAIVLLALMGGSALTTELLKHHYHMPRPVLDGVTSSEPGFSFPSGHAVLSVAFYGYWMVLPRLDAAAFQRWILWGNLQLHTLLLFLLPLGVMWSRLYSGKHWLGDVSAGALIALCWLIGCITLRQLYVGLLAQGGFTRRP
jgi:undecaprenyl-diphosphatase